jgi:hypothetical protein
MSSFSVVRINPDKALHYTIGSSSYSNYDYALRWFVDTYDETLPPINRFTLSRNLSVSTDDLLDNQQKCTAISRQNSLFPLSVRYIDKYGNHYVERPPFKIKINYKNARAAFKGTIVDDIEIWIPWTLMVIPSSFSLNYSPDSIRIYYSSEPLSSTKTQYLHSLLPNTYASGSICWSHSFQKLISMDNTRDTFSSFDMTYWHSMIINDYMMGGWNNDLHSQTLASITQHAYSNVSSYRTLLSYSKDMDDNQAEDYLLNKYPALHKYIHMEKYPDLCEKVRGILINKFDIYKNYANVLTDFNYTIPNRKRRPKYDEAIGHMYSKLFAFLSVSSLSETLQFYSDVSGYNNEFNSGDAHRSTFSFSKILSNYKSEISVDNRYFTEASYPILLPFTSLTKNNVELLASSTACYKNINVYYAVLNIPLQKLRSNQGQSFSTGSDFFRMYKVDPNVFFPLIDNYMDQNKDTSIYLTIDYASNELSIVDKEFFVNIISNAASLIKEKLDAIVGKKSMNRYSV